MVDLYKGTRFITVAETSDFVNKMWKLVPFYTPPPPLHKDYALMKVLSRLRRETSKTRYRVHAFKREQTITPIDFSTLKDSDVIFIVGHGNQNGLYAMGPILNDATDALVKLLTGDGNLKSKRAGKDITILLLSCRAGFGFHKVVARRLSLELGRDLNVGGAIGFTFGSIMTTVTALNEVLIKGIPWLIDFPTSIKASEAEKETSKREGKTIRLKDKEKEIKEFKRKKTELEDGFKRIMAQLKSTEVNDALDELEQNINLRDRWWALMEMQFGLYHPAKKESNLEFDMWFDPPHDGYVWTTGKKTTDAEVTEILKGDLELTDDGPISVR